MLLLSIKPLSATKQWIMHRVNNLLIKERLALGLAPTYLQGSCWEKLETKVLNTFYSGRQINLPPFLCVRWKCQIIHQAEKKICGSTDHADNMNTVVTTPCGPDSRQRFHLIQQNLSLRSVFLQLWALWENKMTRTYVTLTNSPSWFNPTVDKDWGCSY